MKRILKEENAPIDIEDFNAWCKFGIEGYSNFPVGRSDKLGIGIIQEYLRYKGLPFHEKDAFPILEYVVKQWRKMW